MISYEVHTVRRGYLFTTLDYEEAYNELFNVDNGFIVSVENGERKRLVLDTNT